MSFQKQLVSTSSLTDGVASQETGFINAMFSQTSYEHYYSFQVICLCVIFPEFQPI